MAFTYDLTTDVGKIRLLIPDKTESDPLFSDEEIEQFFALEGSIKRAAALGKETTAGDQVLVLKVISHLDLSTNGAAMAAELRAQAQLLREQDAQDDTGDVDVIEMEVGAFAIQEQRINEAVRES